MVFEVSQNPKLASIIRFSWHSRLLVKMDSKFLSYGQISVCFTEEQQSQLNFKGRTG